MRKFTLFFVLMIFAAWSQAQVLHGVSWVTWANEPDYEGVTGYDANPYENPEVTILKAPSTWTPVNSVASFDATWDLLGDEHMVGNPTNVAGGDLFDLDGDGTFGASWKGVHDGENFYVLLKYRDTNGVADADSKNFEIMAQPTSPVRHEPSFLAASDSTADRTQSGTNLVMEYQNQSYARSVALGGGKAVFNGGMVSEYAASLGVVKNEWQNFYTANWGANEYALNAFLDADHFWDETDGVIRAVLVMSLDGVLSYPADITDLEGDRESLKIGETFAFDVKSNAKKGEDNIEYFWSADKNNGYASNYYSGHLTLSAQVIGEEPPVSDIIIHGISWVNWANEPDYEGVTGYDANPYDNPEVTIFKAPATWTPVTDNTSFDATWDILGTERLVANPTNVAGGDLFDLDGDGTFGASWKGVHDGQNFYVLLKYWDTNGVANADSRTFEIMAQPTSPVRHEPSFLAAADSTADKTQSGENLVMEYQNQSYARSVELGGGKAVFANGAVSAYEASKGVVKNAWQNFYTANWGANEYALNAFLDADHYWNETDGVIRAVLVMSLDGVLSYPTDPTDLDGDRTALQIGETFAFDVKSNAKRGEDNIEYFWSADKNNGYASNYYSGHLTLSNDVVTSSRELKAPLETRVYIHNGILMVKGNEAVNLEVYNMLGARLKTARNVSRLSVQDLQNGVYLVRINNERTVTKVVKY